MLLFFFQSQKKGTFLTDVGGRMVEGSKEKNAVQLDTDRDKVADLFFSLRRVHFLCFVQLVTDKDRL